MSFMAVVTLPGHLIKDKFLGSPLIVAIGDAIATFRQGFRMAVEREMNSELISPDGGKTLVSMAPNLVSNLAQSNAKASNQNRR